MLPIESNFNKILYNLIGDEPLCIGVSGGSDSTAMLFLVKQYSDIYRNKVLAVTVDHMLRVESKNEALRVKQLCAKLGLEHHIICWQHSDIPIGKIEVLARNARYDIFKKECIQNGIKYLLVAHNADEQLETYFMRKDMHSEERGLACMSVKRTIDDGITIIRPCLTFAKEELRDYLLSKNIEWFEDSMNDDPGFIRVRYRRQIKMLTKDERFQLMNKIRALGIKRRQIEILSTNFLKTYDIIDKNGFASIPQSEFEKLELNVQRDVLKRVIKCIGHQPYSISDAVCDAFIRSKSAYNHSRIVMKKVRNSIIIYHENRNIEQEMHINAGTEIVWNNRFKIKSFVDELSIKTYGHFKSILGFPSYIAVSLPEFSINNKIIHVGHQNDASKGFLCNLVIANELYDVFLPF